MKVNGTKPFELLGNRNDLHSCRCIYFRSPRSVRFDHHQTKHILQKKNSRATGKAFRAPNICLNLSCLQNLENIIDQLIYGD